ncbi:hypothetical protein Tco_0404532 [Tanacetum coccineum]
MTISVNSSQSATCSDTVVYGFGFYSHRTLRAAFQANECMKSLSVIFKTITLSFKVDERVVQELGTWSINILDESLDSQSTEDENKKNKADISEDANSVDDISEEKNKSNNENPVDQNMEKNINANHQSDSSSHDLSRLPSFEHFKKKASSTSNCSTLFARFRKKEV